jgi:hypothetical protein
VPEPGEKALTLRLANLATGRDEWRQTFAAGSVAVESLKPELTGVVEPDGTFHLIEAATGKGLWKDRLREDPDEKVKRKPLEGVKAVRLVADSTYVFLAFEEVLDKESKIAGPWTALFRAGLPAVPVHGMMHARERGTGRHRWFRPDFRGQMLFVGREAETLPGLVLASRVLHRKRSAPGEEEVVDHEEVAVVHKGSGKLLYWSGLRTWTPGAVLALAAGADGQSMQILAEKLKLTFTARK